MHSSASFAAYGSNSGRLAGEEPNRPFVSDVRNVPNACAVSSGIVIIVALLVGHCVRQDQSRTTAAASQVTSRVILPDGRQISEIAACAASLSAQSAKIALREKSNLSNGFNLI